MEETSIYKNAILTFLEHSSASLDIGKFFTVRRENFLGE